MKKTELDGGQSLAIASYFINTCVTAYYCDLVGRTVQILREGEGVEAMDLPDEPLNIDKAIAYYVGEFVYPDDRPLVLAQCDSEYARETLKTAGSYSFRYRELQNGETAAYRGVVIRGADEDHVVLFFRNITEEFRQEQENVRAETARRLLAENNARMLALADTFEALYDVELGSGSYETYLKGKDFYQEISSHLVEKHEFFADTQENVGLVVWPDDRDGFRRIVTRENIRRVLAENDHFDWTYRLIVGGAPAWFRMRVVYKDAEKRNVIIGIFNAEEEVLARQKDEQLQKDLLAKMMGDDGLFLINCAEDRRKTVYDRCTGADRYSDDEKYSVLIERYISGCVVQSDRERMREASSIAVMTERLKSEKEYAVEYMDVTTGIPSFYEMKVARFSDTEVLQSFVRKDAEILNRMISAGLENDYFGLFCVDLDSGMIKVLKKSPWYPRGEEEGAAPYSAEMETFASLLDGKEREFFERISDVGYLRQRFAEENKATYTYRSPLGDGTRWVRVTCLVLSRKEDGDPALLMIGFNNMDSDASERAEMQERLTEDMQIIGGLADEYVGLYHVNMDAGVFKVYSLDGQRIPDTQQLVSQGGDCFEVFRKFAGSDAVHPDDRRPFLELNADTVRERLLHSKKFSIRFRRNYGGEYLWSVMDVIKYEGVDERANVIAVGFAECDAESRSKQTIEDGLSVLRSDVAPNEAIDRLLSLVGEYCSARRAYVFEYERNRSAVSCTYEWCAESVGAMIGQRRNLPAEKIAGWLREFGRQGAYSGVGLQGTGNMIAVPIMREHETVGLIGVDDPLRTANNLPVLRTFASIAYSEILKRNEIDGQNAFTGFFLEPFYSAYYVGLDDMSFRVYKRTEDLCRRFPDLTNYLENIYVYIRSDVHPDDRLALTEFVHPESIRKALEEQPQVSLDFRDISNGSERIFRCQVIRGADANHAAMGFLDVSEEVRKQQEKERAEELANQQRHLHAFGSMINAALWSFDIDDGDRLTGVYWSDEMRHMLGYEGETDFPNVLASVTDRLHPDDRERTLSQLRSCFARRDADALVYDVSCRLLRKSGEYGCYHSAGRMEYTDSGCRRLYGILTDITAERKLEEQHALSDGLSREYHTVWLVEGGGEHRLHLFRSTGVKTVMSAVQRGLDEPVYDGTMVKYVMTSVHEDDRERVLEASKFENVVRETPEIGTYVISYKRYCDDGGGVDYHQMCFARAAAADGTVNYILAFRDADRMLREQIAQQEQLREALYMAQSASRAKTAFLNNMSHDIRTPMNAIIGYTGLAESHIDSRQQALDYLGKIRQSSDHLMSLINDVLDMSRIESGKMSLNEKEENLSEILHTLRDIVQTDVHSKQLDFFLDAAEVGDEDIFCDRLKLNQVLLNLLSNAIKYTPAGGTVFMRVREKSVGKSGYGVYEFRVKDTGIGMDQEFLKTIFDPFTRAKSTTVSGIQGTGLGMPITKNIVDMMGGSISIESEPGLGTEVTVSFSFRLQSAPKTPVRIPELEGVRVLVTDDDADSCLSVCNMVRDVGMRYEWCTSGKEAVIRAAAASRINEPFGLYIIDWSMPDMNGVETVRRIRRTTGSSAPIILLTAYDISEIGDEAREAGVTTFVAKPMFPSDLHKALGICLGKIAAEKAPSYDFTGKKVLLVEDNELNREIAAEILEECGFLVDTAEDGSVAVDKVKAAGPDDYDLVLMDIQMPVMDGCEATRRIRALGTPISKIPILAMTANAFEEDRRDALSAGMDEHIAKPIDVDRLKETLARFL